MILNENQILTDIFDEKCLYTSLRWAFPLIVHTLYTSVSAKRALFANKFLYWKSAMQVSQPWFHALFQILCLLKLKESLFLWKKFELTRKAHFTSNACNKTHFHFVFYRVFSRAHSDLRHRWFLKSYHEVWIILTPLQMMRNMIRKIWSF